MTKEPTFNQLAEFTRYAECGDILHIHSDEYSRVTEGGMILIHLIGIERRKAFFITLTP